jgi:PleD family two-component response regulator
MFQRRGTQTSGLVSAMTFNASIHDHILETEKRVNIDPVTSLPDEPFFRRYLECDISTSLHTGVPVAFCLLELDTIDTIIKRHGVDGGDDAMRKAALLLHEFKQLDAERDYHRIFRVKGPGFSYYANGCTSGQISFIAEEIRMAFRKHQDFPEPVTISAGCVHLDEFTGVTMTPGKIATVMVEAARTRIRTARRMGANAVCSESPVGDVLAADNTVLIVEPDDAGAKMLEDSLKSLGMIVSRRSDGISALELIRRDRPAAVISEVIMPRLDGFELRERLLEIPELSLIPFILISHKRDDASLTRAHSLGLAHFLKKPYSITEITGITRIAIENYVRACS